MVMLLPEILAMIPVAYKRRLPQVVLSLLDSPAADVVVSFV